ncbi:hypothetical protein PVOR_25958 [Paenibacillus vortex V453]|uniref:Uncharacterized protein n=1 Tax=Paenibacillus vortex V453 TaxID=715225 RepID=A0A2R9SPM0_9BACL|nr:hypothetical protein [Paenibacillus vortex]EFU39286.1 hypothetical protein PVOR_25958 [Paenibacillus vortex V453]
MHYNDRLVMPHPILLEARQVAPNQIVMMYDKQTDLASATTISNYWIRSNMESPTGIASVGMGDALTTANSIRPEMGMITPADHTGMRFVMTFRGNAVPGILYVVLPCFVNLEGMAGYMGANWGPSSRNAFIGM